MPNTNKAHISVIDHPDVFRTNGTVLFCIFREAYVTCDRKYLVI